MVVEYNPIVDDKHKNTTKKELQKKRDIVDENQRAEELKKETRKVTALRAKVLAQGVIVNQYTNSKNKFLQKIKEKKEEKPDKSSKSFINYFRSNSGSFDKR